MEVKSTKFKVLFIPKWYPSRVHDLNGVFIKKHALAANIYNDVAVLFAINDPTVTKNLIEEVVNHEDGVFTVRLYYRDKIFGIAIIDRLIKFLLYYHSLFKGYSIIKRRWGKPNLTHPHILLRSTLFALYLQIVFGIKYLIGEHWTGYTPYDGSYKGHFRKLLCRVAVGQSVAVTPDSMDLGYWMRMHGLKSSYFTINNVVDTDIFNIKEETYNQRKSIIHISSLDARQKNINGIFDAIAEIWKIRKDFEFNIIGGNDNWHLYRERCEKLGLLNTCIFYHGNKYADDLASSLRLGDFFVLFSNYENNPCVIVESLACGVPVIATDVGGVKEMIKEGMGILTPPQDVSKLIEHILYMLDNHKKYNKEKLRAYAIEKYSYEAIALRYLEVYSKVVRNSPSGSEE